jgi:dTDP-4-dehydrorhamnose reductase
MVVVGTGWVGTKMAALLNCRAITHQMAEYETFRGEDWVINCAGRTGKPNVDACERERAETVWANSFFPLRLHEMADKAGARFAHFSSGCIYQGGPHEADAMPNFFASTYSASKAVSDQVLKDRALVFRIRMPFDGSGHAKCLLTKLRQYAKHGKLWNAVNSLSEIDEMTAIAAELIRNGAPNGPYNLVNRGTISTREIAEICGIRGEWFKGREFMGAVACPRSVCELVPNVPTRHVRDALIAATRYLEAA